jgi:hypothetical protein
VADVASVLRAAREVMVAFLVSLSLPGNIFGVGAGWRSQEVERCCINHVGHGGSRPSNVVGFP